MTESQIDPVVELADLLVVTRRFRDADLTVEDARHILAQVRERAHRALSGLPVGEVYPPQIKPALGEPYGRSPPAELMEKARAALQKMGFTDEPNLSDALEDTFAPQIVKRLRACGIENWDALAGMTRAEIEDLPGLGHAMADSIAGHLAARGLKLKGEAIAPE